MVRAEDLVVDLGRLDLIGDPLRHQEVVDPPAGVLFPGLEAVAPPTVFDFLRVEPPEAVGEARRLQLGHLGPLLVGKAGVAAVGLGVLDVDFLVGDVQIAAEDHRLLGVQPQEIIAESVFPLHPVVQALEPVLAVGGVAVDQVKAGVLEGDHTPLLIVLFRPHPQLDRQRGRLTVAGSAGVALFIGRVGVLGVALGVEIRLAGLHLGFLEAEDVGVQRREALGETVGQAGPQAVDIPADQFHTVFPFVTPHIWSSRRRS